MNETKCQPQRNGALIRTLLTKSDLAELSRRAKAEGRSRSNYVTRLLQEKISSPENQSYEGKGVPPPNEGRRC